MNYLDNIVLDALCFKTSHGTSLFMKSRVTKFLKEHTCSVVGGTSPTQSLTFGQCKDPLGCVALVQGQLFGRVRLNAKTDICIHLS